MSHPPTGRRGDGLAPVTPSCWHVRTTAGVAVGVGRAAVLDASTGVVECALNRSRPSTKTTTTMTAAIAATSRPYSTADAPSSCGVSSMARTYWSWTSLVVPFVGPDFPLSPSGVCSGPPSGSDTTNHEWCGTPAGYRLAVRETWPLDDRRTGDGGSEVDMWLRPRTGSSYSDSGAWMSPRRSADMMACARLPAPSFS